MKQIIYGAYALLALLLLSFNARSAELTGCEAKKAEIRQQIDYAKTHGNQHRVAGLEKALSETEKNCTDSGLRAANEAKVQEKKQKVAEREAELASARETDNAKKIAKKQKKVQEAKAELAEAEAALHQ